MATYKISGHGVATLARFVARETQIDNFITASTLSSCETLDSVVLLPSSYSFFNTDIFKLKGKKVIVFKRVDGDESADFDMREVASREEFNSLVETFKLQNVFMEDALSFPMPFSRLFRFMNN